MAEPRPAPAAGALRRAVELLVRRGLRGVWWRGTAPPGAFVWAANHHSWWDPFVALAVLRRLHRRSCVLMHQHNLDRYTFARPLAVFGTAEHRRGLDYLGSGHVLVIFPEGELRPAGPPAALAGGAAWFADRAGVPLCAVATRVLMRGEQHPEAYLWLTAVEHGAALPDRLRAGLAELDQLAATADPRTPLPGFTRVVPGRRSADERVDQLTRHLPWPR